MSDVRLDSEESRLKSEPVLREVRRLSDVQLENGGNRLESGLVRWREKEKQDGVHLVEHHRESGLVRLEEEVEKDDVRIESEDNRLKTGRV